MAAARTGTTPAAGTATETEFSSAAQRERRQRILDATLTLASRGGYEAVQMRAGWYLFSPLPFPSLIVVADIGRAATVASEARAPVVTRSSPRPEYQSWPDERRGGTSQPPVRGEVGRPERPRTSLADGAYNVF